jgi:hypothetical protein
VNFGRYCFHGDIPLSKALQLWQDNAGSALAVIALMPISFAFCLKDQMQKKVEKTHLAFDEAIASAEFEYDVLNEVRNRAP